MSAGRVAVVTGGAQGIGKAIADALAADGCAVAVWDVDEAKANAAAGAFAAGLGVAVDVADLESVRSAAAATEAALGPVGVLVNNAGIDVIGPFLDSDPNDWNRVIAVNYRGQLNTCFSLAPGMVERGWGRIVNIASDAARVGSSGEAVYSGSKGAVVAFSKALAREVARAAVTVNCVCPGPTETALLDQVAAYSQRLYESLAKAIPMRRTGRPDDIAPVVAFLASDVAGYITGQTLSVSGGLTMA